MNFALGLKRSNCWYCKPRLKGLVLNCPAACWSLIVDPADAKFAPREKLDPIESRYGLRKGSPKLCAEITKLSDNDQNVHKRNIYTCYV